MKQRYSLKKSCLFCSFLCISIFSITFVNASLSPQDLRQTILILDRARNNGIVEYRAGVSAGQLSEVEDKEFRTFLNYLGRRIYYYCGELEKTVPPANTDGLPCHFQETNNLQVPENLPPPPSQTTTKSDETSKLDSSLNSALGQFDEMLLRENEQIASRKSAEAQEDSQSNGDGSDNGQGSGASGSSGSEGKSGSNGTKTQPPQQTSQGGTDSGGAGMGNQDSKTTPRKDQQGMHEDDDIVARQLREAAEKETDPEIKEKLWEEYRKYKKGS
jgi:uncharacterized membrane protein YgcG